MYIYKQFSVKSLKNNVLINYASYYILVSEEEVFSQAIV